MTNLSKAKGTQAYKIALHAEKIIKLKSVEYK